MNTSLGMARPRGRAIKDSLIALAIAASMTQAATAQSGKTADVSDWSADSKSAMRLIAGGREADAAAFRAGVEIQLQPKWHTYWRYPGDSGVPPRFDFSGSQNVKTAKVLYPAPHLFTDETGNSIGYTDDVIFPVQIVARQPDKPVTLRLKIDYAVCEKLCIPAEGKAELTLPTGTSTQDAALKAAETRVPRIVSAAEAGLSLQRVDRTTKNFKPLIAVDLKTDSDKPISIFAEGPTPEWALPVPRPAQGAPKGHRQFGFELDGLPPGVSPKGPFELTFTIVEDGRPPISVTTRLD
ncbi:MAG: cytochrome C biogenesis protein [Rhodopseudomonas sp.]|nr:cytochrome C biogenesis protein [Rhodopseudomonas sp.]